MKNFIKTAFPRFLVIDQDPSWVPPTYTVPKKHDPHICVLCEMGFPTRLYQPPVRRTEPQLLRLDPPYELRVPPQDLLRLLPEFRRSPTLIAWPRNRAERRIKESFDHWQWLAKIAEAKKELGELEEHDRSQRLLLVFADAWNARFWQWISRPAVPQSRADRLSRRRRKLGPG
jgi:hypothetical protein